MGRKKKYGSPKLFEKAVGDYFDSVGYTTTIKYRDEFQRDDGRIVDNLTDAQNDRGEEIREFRYLKAPTVTGLCLFAGISRETWAEYSRTPGYADICETAKMRMQQYLEERLCTERHVQGIMFQLKNNYGYADKREVSLDEDTRRSVSGAVAAAALTSEEKRRYIAQAIAQMGGEVPPEMEDGAETESGTAAEGAEYSDAANTDSAEKDIADSRGGFAMPPGVG